MKLQPPTRRVCINGIGNRFERYPISFEPCDNGYQMRKAPTQPVKFPDDQRIARLQKH